MAAKPGWFAVLFRILGPLEGHCGLDYHGDALVPARLLGRCSMQKALDLIELNIREADRHDLARVVEALAGHYSRCGSTWTTRQSVMHALTCCSGKCRTLHHGALSLGWSLNENRNMIDAPPVAATRSLDRLMIAAVAALALTVAASVVSIAFDIHRLSVISHVLSDASSGNVTRFAADLAAAHASDNQTAVIGIVEAVVIAIAAVCFIAWFHRGYSNLLRLGATTTRYGPGWAIGAWFVPILNLWRPKQIANDIWRGSDPRRAGEQPSWSEPVSPLLWFWWGAWLLNWVLGRVSAQDWNNATTAHALRSATRLDTAAEFVSIVAAGFACVVVYTLTKRETERASASQTLDSAEMG